MDSARNLSMPSTAARLAFVYHLISSRLGRRQRPYKLQATRGHSLFSAILIVGFMTVGTILAISMLQLLFAVAG
jgi:hypothetical protein